MKDAEAKTVSPEDAKKVGRDLNDLRDVARRAVAALNAKELAILEARIGPLLERLETDE